jgi:hypothetical protein
VTVLAAAPASSVVTGVLGFLVVAAMGLALFFLLRSLNKQLRKVVPGPQWREHGRPRGQGQLREQGQRRGQPGAASSEPQPNGSAGADRV